MCHVFSDSLYNKHEKGSSIFPIKLALKIQSCRSRDADPHGNLWECVRDRMQAAILLLGHTFCLEEYLNGHLFVQYFQCMHTNLSAELDTSSNEEEAGSCSGESKEGNQQETKDVISYLDNSPSCPRCSKHLGQVGSAATFTGHKNMVV